MKLYVVRRRYGLYAIDLVDVNRGSLVEVVMEGLDRETAEDIAWELNRAYATGYKDASGKWPKLELEGFYGKKICECIELKQEE